MLHMNHKQRQRIRRFRRILGFEQLESRRLLAGDLDLSYGAGGRLALEFVGPSDNPGHALAFQADGKILAAGYVQGVSFDFSLARYETNGSLDTSYGNGGHVSTNFAGGSDL